MAGDGVADRLRSALGAPARGAAAGGVLAAALLVALLAGPATVAAAAPAVTPGERITSYDVALTLGADGTLRVVERIGYDFGLTARHGIVRDIVNRQRYDATRNRVYPVRDVTVSSPEAPAQFTVTESGGQVHVRIGDPNRTVTGRQQYLIGYTVTAASTRLADHDELYWNAVGPGWSVPVEQATVTVTGPTAVRAVTCYAGPVGGAGRCAQASRSGPTAHYRGGPLAPGEALTVVAGWPTGTAAGAAPVLADRLTPQRFLARRPWVLGAGLAVIAGPLLLLLRRRRQRATARAELAAAVPSPGPPETAPPDGIPPGLAGLLVAGSAQRPHVIATLTDLAGRGYLAIEPAGPGDWQLRALRGPDGGLRPWEQALLAGIFRDSAEVRLSGLRRRLPGVVSAVRAGLRADAVAAGWLRPRRGAGLRVGAGTLGCVAIVAGIPVLVALGLAAGAGAVGLAVIVAGVLLLVAAALAPPRLTPAGAAMRARVTGFSQWLGTVHPAGLPAADEEAALRRMLPYAVAFGFAPALVQAFTPVLAGARYATGDWLFYQQIGTFTSDVDSAATPASSGGGGGGSGFSGGSSGDGGGGGGGSSW